MTEVAIFHSTTGRCLWGTMSAFAPAGYALFQAANTTSVMSLADGEREQGQPQDAGH